MADPITWRNVSGYAPAEASRPLAIAQQTIGGAFDAFNNIIKNREEIDAKNVGVLDENAKNAYLDSLNQAKMPEELAAMRLSGVLDQRLAALSPEARAAVRGSDEARLTSLRQQNLAGIEYGHKTLDEAQAPIRDAILTAALRDPAKALTMLDANPNLRNAAELQKAIKNGEQDLTRFGWEKDKHGFAVDANTRANAADTRAADSHGLQMQTGQLQLDAAQRTNQDELSSRRAEALAAQLAQAHQTAVSSDKAKVQAAADEAGLSLGITIPRNTDGSVNVDRLETADKDKINTYFKWKGIPTLDKVGQGDTAAADAARAAIRADPTLRPSIAAKTEALLPGLFGTTPTPAIGNDAATIDRNSRVSDLLDQDKKNQFGSVVTANNSGDVFKAGETAIGKYFGLTTYRGETAREALAGFKGIPVTDKDGKPITDAEKRAPLYVMPNEDEMSKILSGITTTIWHPGGGSGIFPGGSSVKDALEKWANDPVNQEKARQTYNLEMEKKIRDLAKSDAKK